MRFSLQDVKRQVRRRDGELTVTLHFLRPGELRTEIARLVAYYEQQCNQPHRNFAQDEASAFLGDYRLASCLLPTLSAWYNWHQPAWSEAVKQMTEETRRALDEAEIRSPVALRLSLFDYVNAHYAGFLDTKNRTAAQAAFADRYHLAPDRLPGLLALDTEDESILQRETDEPPDVEAVAGRYNQLVFEAALFNASEVHFVIDCEAFLATQHESARTSVTGLGAVIKRLCYLARRLGVYYDLAYEERTTGTRSPLLHLTLYGPQEMTGSPQQYGQRLARLCRLLLGYGLSPTQQTRERRQANRALLKAIQRADATIHIFQNTYRFQMDSELLALLPAPAAAQENVSERPTEQKSIYDSGIEQSFAEAFAALESRKGVDGWQLEREPEPLLLSAGGEITATHGIFIPDFALTRGQRRIYIEILGYWTPAYRERKIQKLQYLKGRADLLLALPVEAHAAFASLAADFPLIEYRNQLSATELLRILQTRYDDFAERLAQLDTAQIQATLRAAAFLSERACYELFHCYRRSELPRAISKVLGPGITYTPGFGLYLSDWLEPIHTSFVEWIENKGHGQLSLTTAIQEWQGSQPELVECDEQSIEILFGLWPEVHIQRSSIFEALLVVETGKTQTTSEIPDQQSTEYKASTPDRVLRERRTGTKKRPQQEAGQQNLWE